MDITIGKIINTHGISGEVKVQVYSDSITRFEGMERVCVSASEHSGPKQFLHITGIRYHKDVVLMTFAGIETMTQAEGLKNHFLQVPEEELPSLPKGRHYIYQLEGLSVWEKGTCYGTLKEVMQPGSNDVYVVTDGRREILIPALKTVIIEVDLPNGRMEVELPAGLLDIYP
ncbi:MAG: ribosome maturation factor RimM [Clostridiales bacterium]|nr:ribosome maturation factor RimM [Clostridiales bacterium]